MVQQLGLVVYKTVDNASYRACFVNHSLEEDKKVSPGTCNRRGCGATSIHTLDLPIDVTDPFGIAWSMRDRSKDPILRVYLCDACVGGLATRDDKLLVNLSPTIGLHPVYAKCTKLSLDSLMKWVK